MDLTKILIVEDEEDILALVHFNLNREGYHTICATSGEEGLRLARQEKPQLVLLDLMLPDRDGQELMAEFLGKAAETKIIVITANGSINRAVGAMREGAFDFLVKPFDEQRLLSSVNNAIVRGLYDLALAYEKGDAQRSDGQLEEHDHDEHD